jgi:hypothetical protein
LYFALLIARVVPSFRSIHLKLNSMPTTVSLSFALRLEVFPQGAWIQPPFSALRRIMAPHLQNHMLEPVWEVTEPPNSDIENTDRFKSQSGSRSLHKLLAGNKNERSHSIEALPPPSLASMDDGPSTFHFAPPMPIKPALYMPGGDANVTALSPKQVKDGHARIRQSGSHKNRKATAQKLMVAGKPAAPNVTDSPAVKSLAPEEIHEVTSDSRNERLPSDAMALADLEDPQSEYPPNIPSMENHIAELEGPKIPQAAESVDFPHASGMLAVCDVPETLEMQEKTKTLDTSETPRSPQAPVAKRIQVSKLPSTERRVATGRVIKASQRSQKPTSKTMQPQPWSMDTARAMQILQWTLETEKNQLEDSHATEMKRLAREASIAIQKLEKDKTSTIQAAEHEMIQARQDHAVLQERLDRTQESLSNLRAKRREDEQKLGDFTKRLHDARNFLNGMGRDLQKERRYHSEFKNDCAMLKRETQEMHTMANADKEKAYRMIASAELLIRRQQALTKDAVAVGDQLAMEKAYLEKQLEEKIQQLGEEREARKKDRQENTEKATLEATLQNLLSNDDAPLVKQLTELSKALQSSFSNAANIKEEQVTTLLREIHSRPEAVPVDLQPVKGLLQEVSAL